MRMTKRNFVILMAFGFISMLIMLESCKNDDDIIDSGRTALDHAYECEEVLGPLPKFSCADAIEVSTTKNGSPVTFPSGEEGNGSTNPNDCDHPWAFGMACQTGNKVGRYQGLNSDILNIY
mgnify:FL=1|jgi:hypothetical protein